MNILIQIWEGLKNLLTVLWQNKKAKVKKIIEDKLDSLDIDLAKIIKNAQTQDPQKVADTLCDYISAAIESVLKNKAPMLLRLVKGLIIIMKPIIIIHLEDFDKQDPEIIASDLIEVVKNYLLERI